MTTGESLWHTIAGRADVTSEFGSSRMLSCIARQRGCTGVGSACLLFECFLLTTAGRGRDEACSARPQGSYCCRVRGGAVLGLTRRERCYSGMAMRQHRAQLIHLS